MRSVYANISQKFETYIFGLIGEYAGSHGMPVFSSASRVDWEQESFRLWGMWPCWFRLVFRTTKRRHLGCVMVELTCKGEVRTRKRLRAHMWKPVRFAHEVNALCMFRKTFMDRRSPQERARFEHYIDELQLVDDYLCNFNYNEEEYFV